MTRCGPERRRQGGLTLLELVVAVTILAVFLLPMMLIVAQAKARALRYAIQREVRDLAQRKLFDRVHYYEERDEGDFSVEGRTDWRWLVLPPEMVGQSEQVILQYTIRVELPQSPESEGATGQEGSTYEMSIWTFPDSRWYEEQDTLAAHGQPSLLYGDPVTGAPVF